MFTIMQKFTIYCLKIMYRKLILYVVITTGRGTIWEFLHTILFTNELYFTRNDLFDIHKAHIWSNENLLKYTKVINTALALIYGSDYFII